MTYRNAEVDLDTATGTVAHTKTSKVRMRCFRVMQADRQTDILITITLKPQRGDVKND